MFAKFITFFQSLCGGSIRKFDETSNYLFVEIDDDIEITMNGMIKLIALCGDDFTFLIGTSANCEDANCGMMRYDSHYEGILTIEICHNEKE